MGEKKQAQLLFEQALARDPALLMARVESTSCRAGRDPSRRRTFFTKSAFDTLPTKVEGFLRRPQTDSQRHCQDVSRQFFEAKPQSLAYFPEQVGVALESALTNYSFAVWYNPGCLLIISTVTT